MLNKKYNKAEEKSYKENPFRIASSEMKNREFGERAQSSPPNSVQLSENTCPKPRGEFDPFKFAPTISPHADVKFARRVITGNDRRSPFKICRDVIRIGDGQSIGVESDDSDIGYAENPFVATTPGVFNDHVTGKILRLFKRRRGRIGRRGRRGFHFGGLRRIGHNAVHRFNVRKIMESVMRRRRMLKAEEKPETSAGSSCSGRRRRVAVGPRLIRPQFSTVFATCVADLNDSDH